jgi:hypothetical protein
MVTYHGSCLCGDIAYQVSGEPVLAVSSDNHAQLTRVRPPAIASPARRKLVVHLPLTWPSPLDQSSSSRVSRNVSTSAVPAGSLSVTTFAETVVPRFMGSLKSWYEVENAELTGRITLKLFVWGGWMITRSISLSMSCLSRANLRGCRRLRAPHNTRLRQLKC